MDRCNFCGNILTYGENHTCSFFTFDTTYSHSQPFSENTSNSSQLRTDYKLPSFDIFSDIRVSYPRTNADSSTTGTSETNEFWCRLENDFPEPFNISPVVMESAGVGEEYQSGSDISDLINARGSDQDEMSRQQYRWLLCNSDKMNCTDSSESVNRTDHSDSSISGPRNLVMNPDFLSGSNEAVNGQEHFSEYVTDGHTSLEMHSDVYSKSRKTASAVKQHISSDTNNNALAEPSGMCPRKKKYPCTLCPMEFNKKSHFDNHYRTHTREKPFVCKVCKKAFSQKGDLKRHIMTHTGETPFVCEICNKAFSRKGNLNIHIRTHTGETPFVCEVCKEAFSQKCTLDTHMRTHTGGRPYVCNVCKKAFSQKGNLDTHIRMHSGEKPFKCTVCGKTFRTSSHRNRHQREVHK